MTRTYYPYLVLFALVSVPAFLAVAVAAFVQTGGLSDYSKGDWFIVATASLALAGVSVAVFVGMISGSSAWHSAWSLIHARAALKHAKRKTLLRGEYARWELEDMARHIRGAQHHARWADEQTRTEVDVILGEVDSMRNAKRDP